MKFDVNELDCIIKIINTNSDIVEEAIKKISLDIDNLKKCIINNNPDLYVKWDEMKMEIDSTKKTYIQEKEQILKDIIDYKELLSNNDEDFFKNMAHITDVINEVSNEINKLQ